MRRDKLASEQQQRRYVRVDTVFPVQFRLLSEDGKGFVSSWLHGFTNNVGKGGICLEVTHLASDVAELIKTGKVTTLLELEIPLKKEIITAVGRPIWIKEKLPQANRYLIGVAYTEIDGRDNKRLMRYVWTRRLFLPVFSFFVGIIIVAMALLIFINAKLTDGNRFLIKQLVNILQETSITKQKIKQLNKEKEELQLSLQELEERIKGIEEERLLLAQQKQNQQQHALRRINELNVMLEQLRREKNNIAQQLKEVQNKESVVTEEFLRLDKKRFNLEKANIDKMYQWLRVHQNRRTGLVLSFEGDHLLDKWAFTYDQALAVIAFSNFSDFSRAAKILSFYQDKAKRIDGRFLNAYFADDGSPVEYTVHSGPNIWLGIAILHYTVKSRDTTYLPLAYHIFSSILALQDTEGGIRGGPNVNWYSTEHNLDAYALFNMLYQLTKEERCLQARDKVWAWLLAHTYDRSDIPIKRGKGDATIATDTYAWSIAAIGPEVLEKEGLNPHLIMEFAEDECKVETNYRRPDGEVIKIKGFDFAAQRHLPRAGVVSCEWTAQMVIAFKIMAEYYYKKNMPALGHSYQMKADEYLAELAKMIISSPSPSGQGEGCLPYASQDNVDTGHGWSTPGGSRTGSVAATVYMIFAYYRINPLQLKW